MLAHLRIAYPWLSEEEWHRHLSRFQRLAVPAKTVLLREGEVAQKAYLIESGCLRACFDNHGRDTTFQFFFEQQGFSSLESFRNNTPSFFTFETIEPCILYWIVKRDFQQLTWELEQHPEFTPHLLDLFVDRQLHYMQEFLSFVRDTPAQRYQHLLKHQPHIVQRVPQQYIASYLGITPVSLSRIKARLWREKS